MLPQDPPSGPPSAWPQPAPSWTPPPAPDPGPQRAELAVAAKVVGGLVGGVVLVAFLCIVAVTFLGTPQPVHRVTAPSRPGPGVTYDLTDPDVPAHLAPAAATLATEQLTGQGWDLVEDLTQRPDDADQALLCTRADTGATEVKEISVARGATTATFSVVTYADADQAAAAQQRVEGERWRQCVGGTFHLLPDDPEAPGIAYRLEAGGDPAGALYVRVGRMRAQALTCCAADGEREVARTLARALAEVQGLTPPG